MYKTLLFFLSSLPQRLGRMFAKPATTPEPFKTVTQLDAHPEINCVLVHALSQGSVLAFRCIYDHYAPAVYRVSLRYLQSQQHAEDLVREVFAALWFKRKKFCEPEEVRLFLFTMSRSVAVRSIEKMVREIRSHPPPQATAGPESKRTTLKQNRFIA